MITRDNVSTMFASSYALTKEEQTIIRRAAAAVIRSVAFRSKTNNQRLILRDKATRDFQIYLNQASIGIEYGVRKRVKK